MRDFRQNLTVPLEPINTLIAADMESVDRAIRHHLQTDVVNN